MRPSEEGALVLWSELRDLFAQAIGRDQSGVDLASQALVEAEALGMSAFGVGLLRRWSDEGGTTDPPHQLSRRGPLRHWEVQGRFGPLVLAEAARVAADASRADGMAAVVLHGLGGSGRLAPYAEFLALTGQVGLILASSPPLVAPHGGVDAVWGTNPFALAIPGAERPLVADATTAAITAARFKAAKASGEPLPAGSAIDNRGREVTDPTLVAALLPRGGLMGTLTALLVESLTSGVAGRPAASNWRSATVMAFSTDTPIADQLRQRIEAASAAEPGSRTWTTLEKSRREGVWLSADARAFVRALHCGRH